MKITLEISERNEATSYPWWMIVDPAQNMPARVSWTADQVTGPFFSREEAEEVLRTERYRFGKRAAVYCHSGHRTREYKAAIDRVGRMGGADK
jgi:3-mercaptopyruvate sulfurtransferase SseA